jgi:hypothetical protein
MIKHCKQYKNIMRKLKKLRRENIAILFKKYWQYHNRYLLKNYCNTGSNIKKDITISIAAKLIAILTNLFWCMHVCLYVYYWLVLSFHIFAHDRVLIKFIIIVYCIVITLLT